MDLDSSIDYALARHSFDVLIVPRWSELSVYAAWTNTRLSGFEKRHSGELNNGHERPP